MVVHRRSNIRGNVGSEQCAEVVLMVKQRSNRRSKQWKGVSIPRFSPATEAVRSESNLWSKVQGSKQHLVGLGADAMVEHEEVPLLHARGLIQERDAEKDLPRVRQVPRLHRVHLRRVRACVRASLSLSLSLPPFSLLPTRCLSRAHFFFSLSIAVSHTERPPSGSVRCGACAASTCGVCVLCVCRSLSSPALVVCM